MHMKYGCFCLIFTSYLYAGWSEERKVYNLTCDPVDVVIACHKKDKVILPLCIDGARKYVKNVRRIIIVSDERFTDQAEWFNEAQLPFSKKLIEQEFASFDKDFYKDPRKLKRVGWYFKQIFNFYSAFVIPDVSTNILILDADTVLLRPIEFVDGNGNMLQAPGTEHNQPYFDHMSRILPGLKKVIPDLSGISHHMLFQRAILEDLFELIESYHGCEFWRAYCRSVAPKDIAYSGSADYEIYFNFALMRTNQIKIRPLKWENIRKKALIPIRQKEGYDFVSWHHYTRLD